MSGLPVPLLPPWPASDGTTLYGMRSTSALTPSSSYFCPMMRLTSKIVLAGKRAALFLAAWPTKRFPVSEKHTHDGEVREPRSLGIIVTPLPCHTPTHEYVVPRSMPITTSSAAFPAAALSTSSAPLSASLLAAFRSLTNF